MAKALELSQDTLTAPPSVPKAAQIAPQQPAPKQRRAGKSAAAAKVEQREPLQVRWPTSEVKAAKLAALQMDFPTVSDFMLACFHAYMKSHKQG